MIKFFKLIPLFFLAYLLQEMIMVDYWEKPYLVRLILGIPLLVLLIDLVRLMELTIMFIFSKKNLSVVSLKIKKINSSLNILNLCITFMAVQMQEKIITARKISLTNQVVPIVKVSVFKSLLNKRYYVADYMLFGLLLFKIVLLNLIIFLLKICF